MLYQNSKGSCEGHGESLQLRFIRFGLEPMFAQAAPSYQSVMGGGSGVADASLARGKPALNRTVRCRRCAALLLNMGRWPLGGNPGTTSGKSPFRLPWSFQQYATQVVKLIRWLHAYKRAEGAPVAFLSSAPMPLHGGGAQVECRADLRARGKDASISAGGTELPHAIGAYNDIARAAAEHLNVSFVDIATRTLDLLELSFDGAHYYDPVALAIAEKVEQWAVSVLHLGAHAR